MMETKDLVRLKARLISKAKDGPELKRDTEVWFFCRHLHFIGRGALKYVYPRDIGHGPETPLCSIKGRILDHNLTDISTNEHWEDFQGTIHQDDVCKTREDAIRGLVRRLGKLYDKRRNEMLGFFHKQEGWRKKL